MALLRASGGRALRLVVNEGGGAAFELGGRRFYTLCVGEKGVYRFLVRARGRAGHGSMPALGDNALLKLAPPAVAKLSSSRRSSRARRAIEFLSELSARTSSGADSARIEGAVERLRGPPRSCRPSSPSRCCG